MGRDAFRHAIVGATHGSRFFWVVAIATQL